MIERPFKAIVVGGGIAGLTISNCLQKANIDHVVLEKHKDIVYPSGASIGLWPNASRLLHQLGCLDEINRICAKMHTSYNRLPSGKAIVTSKLFDWVTANHGYPFLLLERQRLIRALSNGLPDKSPIKTGCHVTDIVESVDSVRVDLSDGTFEEGDIVIGCDGVNSRVRDILWDNANRGNPGSITVEEKKSLKTSYKCLVGLSPAIPGLEVGEMTVVHNDGFSFLVLTQPDQTFYFVFSKLDKSHHWPTVPRYTQADADEMAAQLIGLPINESVLFGEIWKRRVRCDLVNVEEGIFQNWHAGRIVLVGDAAHKMTPNIALGGNSAMESAAALVNELHGCLAYSNGHRPSAEDLSRVFDRYQKSREPRVREIASLSSLLTRIHAWENPILKFVGQFLYPWVSDRIVASQFAAVVKGGVTLDFLSKDFGERAGRVAWEGNKVSKSGLSSISALWAIFVTVSATSILLVVGSSMLSSFHVYI